MKITDTERLDWLARNGGRLAYSGPGDPVFVRGWAARSRRVDWTAFVKSPRNAIDAAIRAEIASRKRGPAK